MNWITEELGITYTTIWTFFWEVYSSSPFSIMSRVCISSVIIKNTTIHIIIFRSEPEKSPTVRFSNIICKVRIIHIRINSSRIVSSTIMIWITVIKWWVNNITILTCQIKNTTLISSWISETGIWNLSIITGNINRTT